MEENINCLGNEVLCICLRSFHLWGGLIFRMDDHDSSPNFIMILNSMFPSWIMILNNMFPNWIMILNSMFPSWMMTLNSMFPSWRMIQYFSHWVGDFLSLS